jgi:hypothetical protein
MDKRILAQTSPDPHNSNLRQTYRWKSYSHAKSQNPEETSVGLRLDTRTIIKQRNLAEEERNQQPGSGLRSIDKSKIPETLLVVQSEINTLADLSGSAVGLKPFRKGTLGP